MDFLQAMKKGLEKSRQSMAARREVDEVFGLINSDLKGFTKGDLYLARGISVMGAVATVHGAFKGLELEDLIHDKLVLKLETEAGTFSEDVAGWKQRAEGFPCVLKFDGQQLSCGTPETLSEGILELFSTVRFGNAVNSLLVSAEKAEQARLREASTGTAVDETSDTPAENAVTDGGIRAPLQGKNTPDDFEP